MEDVATAEISRSQLWQWRHHAVRARRRPARRRARSTARCATRSWHASAARAQDAWATAAELMDALVLSDDFIEFLTFVAYPHLE